MAKDKNKNGKNKPAENLNGDVATVETPTEMTETVAPAVEATPIPEAVEVTETPTETVAPEAVVEPPAPVLSPDDPLAILQNARQNAERERNEVLAQIAKLDQESTALHARLATINAALGVTASKSGGKRVSSGNLGDDAQTILSQMADGAVYTYKDLGGMIAAITQYPYHAINQLVNSGKVEKLGRSQYRKAVAPATNA